MPPVVAAVAVIAKAAIAAFSLGALAKIAVTTVISFGISKLGSLLLKNKAKPSLPSFSFAEGASGRTQILRSSIESHKIVYGKVRVSGPLVFAATTNTAPVVSGQTSGRTGNNLYLHLVIVLAAHEIDAIETIYLDETALTFGGHPNFASNSKFIQGGDALVRVKTYLGTTTQTADPDLDAEVSEWTSNHRLQELAYLYVRLQHHDDAFPNGVPNISAKIRGKKVYDPRSATTAYSNNWALCVRDYLSNSTYGLGAASTELDDTTFNAAANTSDELVNLNPSGTQKRYTCNGVVDTADNPIEILKAMASAGAGAVTFMQGKWRCFAGAYTTPSITIDESWLAGEIEVQTHTPRNELFNAVRGVYVEPDKGWQPTDFPMVTNSTYESQDGGVRIPRDVELPFTTHSQAAQRIAKIALEKARQGITAVIPCNYKALQLTAWDTVYVTISKLGWSSKIFRIVEWKFNAEGGINLTLQEESSASYDWNNGEATVYDPAPNTNLPDPNTVNPPGNPVVTETLYSTIDGSGIKVKATITWSPSPDASIYRHVAQYKLTSGSDWTTVGEFINARAEVFDIAPGRYDFRVKAVSLRGVSSAWATTTKEIMGLTAPPADITGFTLNAVHNQAHLQWNQVSDLDVRVVGYLRLRWSSKTSGATWANAIDLGPALPGVATNTVTQLLTGTYFIKAVDSSGNESVNAATILSTVANIVNLNVVKTGAQNPSFSGTKTNMVVDTDDNSLKLDSSTLWDSISPGVNIDDWTGNIDDANGTGIVSSGEYVFTDPATGTLYFDLGAVYTSRVTANIDSLVYDTANLWDNLYPGINIDDWPGLIDGGELSGTTVDLYIDTTNDDPSGSPTWAGYRKFVVGDYSARAYRFKLTVTNTALSNNIKISTLSVTIDMPDREEKFLSQSILSGGSTLTYNKAYFAQPEIGVNIQSAVSGDTPSITHVTSGGKYTGVTLQILNGGSGAARTCDVFAKGY